MPTIGAMLRRIEKLNTDEVIEEAFENTAKEFLDTNKEQLNEGFDATGKHLKKYASKKYASMKNSMNPAPGLGNPDLKLTGAFQRGWVLSVASGQLNQGSMDEKGIRLEEKYGKIYGLYGPFKQDYLNEFLSPTINKKITAITGLAFG